MLFRKVLFVFAVMSSVFTFGQANTIELGVITDNDSYTSSKNDKYYTNGLEIFYRFLDKAKNAEVNKKITEFRIGQYIYNPRSISSEDIATNDRPFAGYLFVEAGCSFFYQNESVVKFNMQIGNVGPNSFGKQTQNYIHRLLHHKEATGWEHQISNTVALQSHIFYSKKIFPNLESKTIDFHFQSEADLGTIFTGASTGFLTRIGFKKLAPIYNSNLYGGAIGSNVTEFYFYLAPSVNYQLYDATIQGGLFKDDSPVTYDLVPLRFNGEAGFKYRKNNLNLGYSFVYKGKEVNNDENTGYFYGSISISFLFK